MGHSSISSVFNISRSFNFLTHLRKVFRTRGVFWYLVRKVLATAVMYCTWTYRPIYWTLCWTVKAKLYIFWFGRMTKRCAHLCHDRANIKNTDDLDIYFSNAIHANFVTLYSKENLNFGSYHISNVCLILSPVPRCCTVHSTRHSSTIRLWMLPNLSSVGNFSAPEEWIVWLVLFSYPLRYHERTIHLPLLLDCEFLLHSLWRV